MMAENKNSFIDLKIPLGSLLVFYGIVLDLYGLFTGKDLYEKSLGININLVWGTVMLVFGLILILMSFRKKHE